MDAGVDYANFHLLVPFPGSKLYEYAKDNDLFIPGLDPADINWDQPTMQLPLSQETLINMITENVEISQQEREGRSAKGNDTCSVNPESNSAESYQLPWHQI